MLELHSPADSRFALYRLGGCTWHLSEVPGEPVAGQLSHVLQRPGFLEQVRCAWGYYQLGLAAEVVHRLAVQFQHRGVLSGRRSATVRMSPVAEVMLMTERLQLETVSLQPCHNRPHGGRPDLASGVLPPVRHLVLSTLRTPPGRSARCQ